MIRIKDKMFQEVLTSIFARIDKDIAENNLVVREVKNEESKGDVEEYGISEKDKAIIDALRAKKKEKVGVGK